MRKESRSGRAFQGLIEFCRLINPPSMTSSAANADEKIRSAEDGLDTAHRLLGNWIKRKQVLILGCGDGWEVGYAREALGWNAAGVTFMEAEYRAAQEHAERQPCVLGDMHALELANASVDFVYTKETLEHSPCPYLALTEINRVLRPGGKFMFLMPCSQDKVRDWYHFSVFPEYVWSDLCRKAYLRVLMTSIIRDGNIGFFGVKDGDWLPGVSVEAFMEHLDFGPREDLYDGEK